MAKMTKDWFLHHYWKLMDLEQAMGDEMPEIKELCTEATEAGLDVPNLIGVNAAAEVAKRDDYEPIGGR